MDCLPVALLLITKRMTVEMAVKGVGASGNDLSLLKRCEAIDMKFGKAEFEKKKKSESDQFECARGEVEEGGVESPRGGDAAEAESPLRKRTMRYTSAASNMEAPSASEVAANLIKSSTGSSAAGMVVKGMMNVAGMREVGEGEHLHECYSKGEMHFEWLVRIDEKEMSKAALVIQLQQRDRMAAKKAKKEKARKKTKKSGSSRSPKK